MSVWLELFHGREDPEEEMQDWGTQGPVIGPLQYVHWTYGAHLKLEFSGTEHEQTKLCDKFKIDPSFPEIRFNQDGSLLLYDGIYYGDFSVYHKENK